MKIAELFVNLGVKGAEKTVSAFTAIGQQLKGLGNLSLETKAGILAAMYALEQLTAKSGAAGTALTNFSALTGESAKTLQQYQYAARQVGISNDETTSTFKTLQDQMSKTLLGKGAPAGLGRVAQLTGGITAADVDKFMKNPELLLQRLQTYAQKEKRVGLRNEALKSFGLSENMIAGLSRGAFRPEVLKKAPAYSDKEIQSLDKANIAWSNLGNKIEMAIGHFNAMHGQQLVKDFAMITDKVLLLVNALLKLADTLKLFKGLAMVTSGAASLVDTLTKLTTNPSKEAPKIKESVTDFVKELPSVFEAAFDDFRNPETTTQAVAKEKVHQKTNNTVRNTHSKEIATKNTIHSRETLRNNTIHSKETSKRPSVVSKETPNLRLVVPPSHLPKGAEAVKPALKTPSTQKGPVTQNFNVNQSLNFAHEGKNHADTATAVHKAVKDAFRQLSSQVQGS